MAKAKKRRNRAPSNKRNSTRAQWDGKAGVFTSSAADAEQLTTLEQLDAWLNSRDPANRGGVDIRGRVIAQLGPFKDGRGEFDQESLNQIVALGNKGKKGLQSYFKHRSMSDDNLGKHLGRDTDLFVSEDGKVRSGHFELSPMAMRPNPEGGGTPYGVYVAGLAISDPSAFSSSLTLSTKTRTRVDGDGKPELDEDGNRKPDIWMPTRLFSIDVVSVGAAVDDFLSSQDGEAEMLSRATEMFSKFFDVNKITPKDAKARLAGFAEKIVQSAFEEKKNMADDENKNDDPQMTQMLETQKETNKLLGGLTEAITKMATPVKPEGSGEGGSGGAGTGKELSRDQFVSKATALCKAQGKPELLGDFLSTEGMTIDGVKDALLSATKDELSLDSENDHQGGKKTKTKVTKDTPWEKLDAEQVEKRLRAEYNESIDVFETVRLSFEDFATDRKIELGLESEKSPMLPIKKKSIAASAAAVVVLALAGLAMAYSFGMVGQFEAIAVLSMMGVAGMATTIDQLKSQSAHVRKVRRKVLGGQTIYNGTITFIKDGFISGAYSAGALFGGIAFNHADNSNGIDGDRETETLFEGSVELPGIEHTLTVADLERKVYAPDNWTLTTANANAVEIGVLKDITDRGVPLVDLN